MVLLLLGYPLVGLITRSFLIFWTSKHSERDTYVSLFSYQLSMSFYRLFYSLRLNADSCPLFCPNDEYPQFIGSDRADKSGIFLFCCFLYYLFRNGNLFLIFKSLFRNAHHLNTSHGRRQAGGSPQRIKAPVCFILQTGVKAYLFFICAR